MSSQNIGDQAIAGNQKIRYIYSASGEKLACDANGSLTYYRSVMIYGNDNKLLYMLTPEGTVSRTEASNGTSYTYNYFKTDHLGSTRVMLSAVDGTSQRSSFEISDTLSLRVAERLGMEAMGIYDKVVGGKIMPHRIYSARSADRVQVPWNPIWEKQFAELEELLAPVLKHTGGSLRHIGGTSLPGSAAVPVIEAEYSPDPGISAARVIHELEPLGFYPLERESGNGLPDFTESLNLKFRHALRIRMI